MWWVTAFAEVPDRGRGRRMWWVTAFAGRTVGGPAFAGDDGLEYVVEVPDRGRGRRVCGRVPAFAGTTWRLSRERKR